MHDGTHRSSQCLGGGDRRITSVASLGCIGRPCLKNTHPEKGLRYVQSLKDLLYNTYNTNTPSKVRLQNPRYLGSRDQEHCGSRPDLAKCELDPNSTNRPGVVVCTCNPS
jgi:hypothetical protein